MLRTSTTFFTAGALLLASVGPLHAEHHHHHHHHHDKKTTTAEDDTAPMVAPESTPAKAAPAATGTAPPVTAGTATPTMHAAKLDDFNFDLGQEKKPLSAAEAEAAKQKAERLQRMVGRRRGVLRAHVALGLITLGVMAATLVLGQLNYDDKFTSDGTYTGKFNDPHQYLAYTTTGLFAATGILALAAPNPYPKKIKADAALAHKLLMAAATAGMIAQIILGPLSVSQAGRLDQRAFANAHLGVGYATWGLMAGGVLAYVF